MPINSPWLAARLSTSASRGQVSTRAWIAASAAEALAGKEAPEDFDMAEVAGRTSVAEGLDRSEGVAHGREVARELEGACFADMGQGEPASAAMARSNAAVAPG